jgi:serine/threonine protein kinase
MASRFCRQCGRQTRDGHLWCPAKNCMAEEGYPLFEYGEYLGDLKITKVVSILAVAAVYEAQRGKQSVLLKVAHPGAEYGERLRREARLLQSLTTPVTLSRSFQPTPRPIRPVLLSPFPFPSPSPSPYGEITVQGEPKVFCVYQPVAGRLLTDLLLENPQLWHYEAAWIIATIAEAMEPLIIHNKSHLNLTPDAIIVDLDANGHWHPTLLDLGWTVTGGEAVGLECRFKQFKPVYAAPEVLARGPQRTISPAADVYSLGRIYFEMLSGQPAHQPTLLYVDQARRPSLVRPEMAGAGVVKIVDRALGPHPAERYPSVLDLAAQVKNIYGPPPPEKRPRPRRWYVLLGILIVIVVIVALLLLLTSK